jgi:hypothetical protein
MNRIDKLMHVALLSCAMVCLVAFASVCIGCTDDSSTRKTLQNAGYTDIQTTGYSMFSCSDSDTFSTGFTAKNPKGVRVSGVVCCGLLKSCTIRF